MNVSSVQPAAAQPLSAPSAEVKRAALQMALLRKHLEAQGQQAAEIAREAEGKGLVLDIRV